MQLRDVAAALRKQDDVNGVLAALKLVDGLIEAAPDERSPGRGPAVTSYWRGPYSARNESGAMPAPRIAASSAPPNGPCRRSASSAYGEPGRSVTPV